jgi:hypothetical protein
MTNTNHTQSKKKPVYRKQLPGGISAAVFLNEYDGRTYRSVNLQRSYKKRDGNWERNSLFIEHKDIPMVIEALNGVWSYLSETPFAYTGASESPDDQTDHAEAPAEAPADA